MYYHSNLRVPLECAQLPSFPFFLPSDVHIRTQKLMCQEETTMCTVTMEHRDLNHLLQAFQDATETLHSLNCVLAPVSSARRQKETLQDLSERRENVLLRISPSTQKENGQWNSADLAELSAVLRGEAKLAQQHVGPFVQNSCTCAIALSFYSSISLSLCLLLSRCLFSVLPLSLPQFLSLSLSCLSSHLVLCSALSLNLSKHSH